MKTAYEIRIYKTNQDPDDLKDFFAKQFEKDDTKLIKSKKKEENVTQYCNFIPPGKHFFYFIY